MKSASAIVALIVLMGAADAAAQWGPYRGGGQQRGGGGGQGLLPVQVGARYRQWTAELDGDIQADEDALAGSEVSMDGLGLDEEEEKLQEVSIWCPQLPYIGAVNASYWWGKFSGDATLTADETFAGTTFTAGTPIRAESDWQMWTFLWETGERSAALGPLSGMTGLTGQVGLKYVKTRFDVDDAAQSARADLRAWLYVIGARATMSLTEWLAFQIEANGTRALGISGVEGTIYDVALGVQLRMYGVFAGAGHRWFRMDLEDTSASHADEVEFDLDLKGFYFEAGLKF